MDWGKICREAAIECGIWKPKVKLIEDEVWYEVRITVECCGSPGHFTFLDIRTGERTFKDFPDCIKKLDVDYLNAHTRFITPKRRTCEGDYRFSRHYLTDELCIAYDETYTEYHRRTDVIT